MGIVNIKTNGEKDIWINLEHVLYVEIFDDERGEIVLNNAVSTKFSVTKETAFIVIRNLNRKN